MIHLNGQKCEFKHFSSILVYWNKIDVFDFRQNLLFTIPRGKRSKKEFETLAYWFLKFFDSSFEFSDSSDGKLLNKIIWKTFYDPDEFYNDLETNHFDLDDSLSVISMLQNYGVKTSNMKEVALRYWNKK